MSITNTIGFANGFAAPAKATRSRVPRWIYRMAVPIILAWIAITAVLNVIVPQLDTVGQMRSVSMSPSEAPSMIAMKRIGKVFEEFDSDSSVMVIPEFGHY